MKTKLLPTIPELEPEDSPDLTDEEVESAIVTHSAGDLAKQIRMAIEASPSSRLAGHGLRYRGDCTYWRVRLVDAGGTDKLLVFRSDWVGE